MRILIIKTSAGYVDVSNATYNLQETGLARAFNKAGHKCDVVYYGGDQSKIVELPYDKNKNFKVYYIKAKNFLKNGIYSKELYKLIEEYDIVHAGGYDQLESWILAKKCPDKLVIYNGTYYSDFNDSYNKKAKIFDLLFLPRYKKYHITFDTKSNLSRDYLRKKGLIDVTSIGVGIDLEQLRAKEMKNSDLSKSIEEEKKNGFKIVTYIGRIEPRRNPIFILDVFKKLSDKEKNVKLLIIGTGSKNDMDEFNNRIKKLNIGEKIIYKEKLEQSLLPKIYSLSDVFLLPTHYEIFGMVLLEAMYFNTPVITTYNGGSNMLIENDKSGIIIKDFNIDEWVNQIIRVLNDKDLKNYLCKNAKQKILNEYTWDKLVPKFIKVFEKKMQRRD